MREIKLKGNCRKFTKFNIFLASKPLHNDDLYRENCPNICNSLSRGFKNCCSIKSIKSRLPIFIWLLKYKKFMFVQDLVAGLSVGLIAIPQSIAYAVIAGFSPEFGLYSAMASSFVYTIFGSCKDITIGPTAIMSLMIFTAVKSFSHEVAVLGKI